MIANSPLLINESPLMVLPSLATGVGLNEAIVIQQLHYWLNNKNAGIEIDGVKWIHNTYQEWQDNFPFWSVRTIRRILNSLEERGLIIATQLNKSDGDCTKSYRVAYDALGTPPVDNVDRGPVDTLTTPHVAKLASSIYKDTETTITETTNKKKYIKKKSEPEKIKPMFDPTDQPERMHISANSNAHIRQIDCTNTPEHIVSKTTANITTKTTTIKKPTKKIEPSALFDDDEAPTKDKISASARNKRDAELREAYNRIHEIAGLPKPISFPKSDQNCLIGALREGATVDRLGIAWQRALETSEAKYWPFHCVIEKLPSLEATKRPPKINQTEQPRQQPQERTVESIRDRLIGSILTPEEGVKK